MGPTAGIPALILGIMAHREIARSDGKLGGENIGTIGASLGLFNLLATVGFFAAIFALSARSSHLSKGPISLSPPTLPSPSPSSGPTSRTPPSEEEPSLTRAEAVREVDLGHVTLVQVNDLDHSLRMELANQQQKALASHQTLLLLDSFSECRPCMSLTAVLLDPRMQRALDRVRLVEVDGSLLGDELLELGVPRNQYPGLYLLSARTQRAEDGISGAEWDDDTPENISPVLSAFLHHRYLKRRKPIKLQPEERDGQPSHGGSFL